MFKQDVQQALAQMEDSNNNTDGTSSLVPSIPVARPSLINRPKVGSNKLPDDVIDDSESVHGKFAWVKIANKCLPIIVRLVDGEPQRYMSVRIAEDKLLNRYLDRISIEMYSCTDVKSFFVTKSEVKLLNVINQKHSEKSYGQERFKLKDLIVKVEDVEKFYDFLSVCDRKLNGTLAPGHCGCFGFIRVNSTFIIPYCVKNMVKYCPLFCFENNVNDYSSRAVEVDGWSYSYLKFCFKLLSFRPELYTRNSCKVISWDIIKQGFVAGTNFEEYWPTNVGNNLITKTQMLPSTVPPAATNMINENSVPQSSIMESPVHQEAVQQEVSNQIQHDCAAQIFNPGQSMVNYPQSYVSESNPSQQIITSQLLPMQSSSSIPLSNTEQHNTTLLPLQQTSNSQYLEPPRFSFLTNAEQCNMVATPVSTIPLSDSTNMEFSISGFSTWPFSQDSIEEATTSLIPAYSQVNITSKPPYMVQNVFYGMKSLWCINGKPYKYLDMMITVRDLILLGSLPFYSHSVENCTQILSNDYGIVLYTLTSEQMAVLNNCVHLHYPYSDGDPVARLFDIQQAFSPYKIVVFSGNEPPEIPPIPLHPAKRQRTSNELSGNSSQLNLSLSATIDQTHLPNDRVTPPVELYPYSTEANDWLNAGGGQFQSWYP